MLGARRNHTIIPAIVLAATALVAGCGGDAAEQATLRFALAASPVTLDPRLATDAASTRINRLLYQQLVDFDERFEPRPALATWQRVGDLRYRFELGEPMPRFHDGRVLTAADVEATYESVLDPAFGSPHRAGLDMIERIEVRDARTVDFVLSEPDPLFPGRLVFGILPAEEIRAGRDFARSPLGSGPFRFVAWPNEDRLLVERRADGQVVEFVRVANPTVRVLKLVRGEVDMLQGDLPFELVEWLRARGEVEVRTHRGTNFAYLGFNMDDAVVGKRSVRRAIAHAIDREAIIHYVLGDAARAANAILTPDHWAGHPGLEAIDYDPERARALLAEAGFDAQHPARIVYKTSSDPFRVRIATILQEQLGRVGVEVDLQSYDWGTFYADVKAGRFQMYSLAWVGIKMPDIFRYALYSESTPPEGANRGRFRSPQADALMDLADRAATLEEQAVLYRRLQELLLAELPYVPLWYEDQIFASRRGLAGYTLSADGNYDGLTTVERGMRAARSVHGTG